MSGSFFFGGKTFVRLSMLTTRQKLCDLVPKVALRSMTHHHIEKVALWFQYDRYIPGCERRANFAAHLSRCEVAKARYPCDVAKTFSVHCESRALCCHMGKMLWGGCRDGGILLTWSKHCRIIIKKKHFVLSHIREIFPSSWMGNAFLATYQKWFLCVTKEMWFPPLGWNVSPCYKGNIISTICHERSPTVIRET